LNIAGVSIVFTIFCWFLADPTISFRSSNNLVWSTVCV
jgi:hypothetical protein